jgi:hypothetical protein
MENNQQPVNPQPDQNLSPQIPSSPKKLRVPMIALSGILLLGIGLLSGYFLFSPKTPLQPNSNQNVKTSPVITIELSPTNIISPTSSISNWKSHTTTQLKDVSFKPYTIQYPEAWIENIKSDTSSYTLALAKDKHMLIIYQASIGGSGCIFEGEMPDGPYIDIRQVKFVEIDSNLGKLRRFESDTSQLDPNLTSFNFCLQANGTYQTTTSAGNISYIVPKNYKPELLSEMDSIIETLSVIN